MKTTKIQKVIIAVGIIILFSGCVNEAPEKTKNGKNVYDSWNNAMSLLINFFDIPFLFNTWLETPEEMRSDVEDALLPYYKIRQLGENEWGLYYGNELLCYIAKNNYTLSQPGAEWKVTYYTPQGYETQYSYNYFWADLTSFTTSPVALKITCSQDNEWNLVMTENESSTSNVNLTLRSLQENLKLGLKNSLFSIQGDGFLTFNTPNYDYDHDDYYWGYVENGYLSFEISNEMVFSHFDYIYYNDYYVPYWSNGSLQLIATNDEGDRTEAGISFFTTSSGQYCANITYRGVTEEWVLNRNH